jgi:hypothetical protein
MNGMAFISVPKLDQRSAQGKSPPKERSFS